MNREVVIGQLFCPQCKERWFGQAQCPACRTPRRQDEASVGQLSGEPLLLDGVATGHPVSINGAVWYRREGKAICIDVERETVTPYDATPWGAGENNRVCGLCRDEKGTLYASWEDENGSGVGSSSTAWHIPLSSQRLGTPVYHQGQLIVAGYDPNLIYQIDIAQQKIVGQRISSRSLFRDLLVNGHGVLESVTDSGTTLVWHDLARDLPPQTLGVLNLGDPAGTAHADHVWTVIKGRLQGWQKGENGLKVWKPYNETDYRRVVGPVAVGDDLLLAPVAYGDQRAGTYALDGIDRETMTKRWRLPLEGHVTIPPACHEQMIAVTLQEKGVVYLCDRKTGQLLFPPLTLPAIVRAQPFFQGNYLYLPCKDGKLYRVCWRETAIPTDEAEAYWAREEWGWAVLAFATAGKWEQSADGLVKLGAFEQGLSLYQSLQLDEKMENAKKLWQLEDEKGESEYRKGEAKRQEERGKFETAGDIYASLGLWEEAIRCFERSADHEKVAKSWARLGAWAKAIEQAKPLGAVMNAFVGECYWQWAEGARKMRYPHQHGRYPIDRELAELYRQAERAFEEDENKRRWECQEQADRWSHRPRLYLFDGKLDRPLQQNFVSRISFQVKNQGFGTAQNITITVQGDASPQLQYVQLFSLAPSKTRNISISLTPKGFGHPEEKLQFAFMLSYEVQNEQFTDGPFLFWQPVLMGIDTLVKTNAGPITIHFGNEGVMQTINRSSSNEGVIQTINRSGLGGES